MGQSFGEEIVLLASVRVGRSACCGGWNDLLCARPIVNTMPRLFASSVASHAVGRPRRVRGVDDGGRICLPFILSWFAPMGPPLCLILRTVEGSLGGGGRGFSDDSFCGYGDYGASHGGFGGVSRWIWREEEVDGVNNGSVGALSWPSSEDSTVKNELKEF